VGDKRVTVAIGEAEERRRPRLLSLLIRLAREKPMGTVGAVIVLLLLFTGIFADLAWMGMPDVGLAPHHYNEINMKDRLAPPSAQYPLGADNVGRDLLSRVIYGARISMIIGLGATLLATIVANIIGLTSGYMGGKVDIMTQRFVDAWLCFPGLVIYLTFMSIIGGGMLQEILVLGIGGGIGASRGSRALSFWIKESAYFSAAQAIGSSTWRIIWRHVLPNVLPMVIVGFSLGIGGIILTEATLSFLGFGIPPPHPSWGGMLSSAGRRYMYEAPWLALWPGIALTLVVYGVNMFGDALRDLIDPRLRGGIGGVGGYGAEQAKRALRKKQAKAEKTELDKNE